MEQQQQQVHTHSMALPTAAAEVRSVMGPLVLLLLLPLLLCAWAEHSARCNVGCCCYCCYFCRYCCVHGRSTLPVATLAAAPTAAATAVCMGGALCPLQRWLLLLLLPPMLRSTLPVATLAECACLQAQGGGGQAVAPAPRPWAPRGDAAGGGGQPQPAGEPIVWRRPRLAKPATGTPGMSCSRHSTAGMVWFGSQQVWMCKVLKHAAIVQSNSQITSVLNEQLNEREVPP